MSSFDRKSIKRVSRQVIAERIDHLMRVRGINITNLANETGVSVSILSLVLNSKRPISPKIATIIARYFDVDLAWLFSLDSVTIQPMSAGRTNSGQWSYLPALKWDNSLKWKKMKDENVAKEKIKELFDEQELVVINVGGIEGFALKVVGNAMANPNANDVTFKEGNIIAVDAMKEPTPGCYVVAEHPEYDQLLFRQYIIDGGKKYLNALNPTYPRLPIDNLSQIAGVVIQKLEWLT